MEKISNIRIPSARQLENTILAKKGLPKKETAKTKKEKLKSASQLKANYCRVCNKMKEYTEFQDTSNPFIDKNGKLSICNKCAMDILNELYQTHDDWFKAFYAFCQHVDILYDESVVSDVVEYVKKYPNSESLITRYWKSIRNKYREKPFRYRDTVIDVAIGDSIDAKVASQGKEKLRQKWGMFKEEEYAFLEDTYNRYTQSFGVSGPNEEDGYKTLSVLLLKQRNNPTDKDITYAIKSQFEMLGIDPKQIRKERKEQGAMTLGLTIEKMELTDPADYYDQPEMYLDHDQLQKDVNSIIRATKNFLIEGNNDFKEDDIDMEQVYKSTESEE